MTEEAQDRPSGAALPRLIRTRWRGLAIAGVAAGIVLAALAGLNQPASESSRFAIAEPVEAPRAKPIDPLVTELARCRSLPADTADAGCQAAWEINRRRFLGESRSLVVPDVPIPDRAASQPAPAGTPASEER